MLPSVEYMEAAIVPLRERRWPPGQLAAAGKEIWRR